MIKKELMQAIEENVKGEQFALYCGYDIDNKMTSMGAGSFFIDNCLLDLIGDDKLVWGFDTSDKGYIYICITYKVINGEIQKAVNDFMNGDINGRQLEDVAKNTTIEIIDVKEI